jgi:hypothetical protein
VLGAVQLIRRLVDVGLVAPPPVGGLIPVECDCAGFEPEVRPVVHFVAPAIPPVKRIDAATRNATVRGVRLATFTIQPGAWLLTPSDQLVQLSVAGLIVAVPAPPVAVMPVIDGMEK